VGVALIRDRRALVTVRAGEPEKGRIDVPGGFLAPEEDAVEGLRREVREELGVEIEVAEDDCISLATHRYGDDGISVLAIGFVGRIVHGEPQPADDVADARWVTADELDELDFAWPHDRELVRRALERSRR
jgi:8-oxo-dGTP diphosphatase